jgi:hypothetical protein
VADEPTITSYHEQSPAPAVTSSQVCQFQSQRRVFRFARCVCLQLKFCLHNSMTVPLGNGFPYNPVSGSRWANCMVWGPKFEFWLWDFEVFYPIFVR